MLRQVLSREAGKAIPYYVHISEQEIHKPDMAAIGMSNEHPTINPPRQSKNAEKQNRALKWFIYKSERNVRDVGYGHYGIGLAFGSSVSGRHTFQ